MDPEKKQREKILVAVRLDSGGKRTQIVLAKVNNNKTRFGDVELTVRRWRVQARNKENQQVKVDLLRVDVASPHHSQYKRQLITMELF